MTNPAPQTPPPSQPPVDRRWPAWLVDTAIAAAGAAALSAAMTAAVGAPLALAAAALAWRAGKRQPPAAPAVVRWLNEEFGAERRIHNALVKPIDDIHTEGWLAGQRSARAVLDHVEAVGELPAPPAPDGGGEVLADWDRWQPGNPEAARRVLDADGTGTPWRDLLEREGIELSDVAAGRVDEIAKVLAEGLERGDSVDKIATALTAVVDDPKWAKLTAWTETNRAISAATMAEYLEDGLTAHEWMTAFDKRVCLPCKANEAAGPVKIGERFPSGQLHPPGHPRCRCALAPVIDVDGLDVQEVPLSLSKAVGGAGGDMAGWAAYWKRSPAGRKKWVDKPHPWTALYRHLRGKVGDARAKRIAAQWHHDVFGIWPGEKRGRNPHGKG